MDVAANAMPVQHTRPWQKLQNTLFLICNTAHDPSHDVYNVDAINELGTQPQLAEAAWVNVLVQCGQPSLWPGSSG